MSNPHRSVPSAIRPRFTDSEVAALVRAMPDEVLARHVRCGAVSLVVPNPEARAVENRLRFAGFWPIVEEVAARHRVTTYAICSRRRTNTICAARADLMREMRSTGLAYVEIGRILKRDHSSVMHALGWRGPAKARPRQKARAA